MNKLILVSICCVLSCGVEGEYLDYASSSEIIQESQDEFVKVSKLDGNSSGISDCSKSLKEIEEMSADIIAKKIGTTGTQIHFVSSATIANNLVILGVARKNPNCHLITSKIEHKSVLKCFQHLESIGYSVTYLDVDNSGKIDLEELRKSIRKDTKLISIQMLNSEIGVLQDISSIGKIAKENGILFHTDASQAFCKYDIDVERDHIDFLTISGHKIGSPQGIAGLYVRDLSSLQPILFGSGDTLFPGTKQTALIASFAKAVSVSSWDLENVRRNYEMFVAELMMIPEIYINSSQSHIVSISISGVLLSDILDGMKEYAFSAGCSCFY